MVQKAIENHLKNLWHKRLFGAVLLILKLLVNFRRPKYVLSDLCQPTEKEKQNRRDRPEKVGLKVIYSLDVFRGYRKGALGTNGLILEAKFRDDP